MKKLNRKGFTLIEVLAVIALIALLGLIAVPGVLRTIKGSRESTYNMMVSNIKIAGTELFEELDLMGEESTLEEYNAQGVKTGVKLTREKVNSTNPNLKVYQIQTNLQSLVSTGFLKGTTKEENGEKTPILINPKDDKNIGFCEIIIRKITEVSSEEKTTYEIIGMTANTSCPKTEEYQVNPQTTTMGNYKETTGSTTSYSFFEPSNYTFYQKMAISSLGSSTPTTTLETPVNYSTISSNRYFLASNKSGNQLLFKRTSIYLNSYKILISTSTASFRQSVTKNASGSTISTGANYYYGTKLLYDGSQFILSGLLNRASYPTRGKITCLNTQSNSSSTCSSPQYVKSVSQSSSPQGNTAKKYTYRATTTRISIRQYQTAQLLSKSSKNLYSKEYSFNPFNGKFTLIEPIKLDWNTGKTKIISNTKYTCLAGNTSTCNILYEVLPTSSDNTLALAPHIKYEEID